MEYLNGIVIKNILVLPSTITVIPVIGENNIKKIEYSLNNNIPLVVIYSKRQYIEHINFPKDIETKGTLVRIIKKAVVNGMTYALVEGLESVEIKEINTNELNEIVKVAYEIEKNPQITKENEKTFYDEIMYYAYFYSGKTEKILPETLSYIEDIKDLFKLIYNLLDSSGMIFKEKYSLYKELKERIPELISMALRDYSQMYSLDKIIDDKVKLQMIENQKEYFYREKIKAIKKELGETDEEENDELFQKIWNSKIPEKLREKLRKEFQRLTKMPDFSAEAGVVRTYIETLVELPWGKETKDHYDIETVEKKLNKDHYGLKKVKEHILELISVNKLIKEKKNIKRNGSIICLLGPPGVGKTSLASSIAKAMKRKFVRISLGGVRDEAEIRGHRRTYVGSMPGRIIKAIKQANVLNPLILLDEIDKMASDFRGDPASAMLEVLDPAQNNTFEDHYIDYPFDLSNVLFICTANDISGIPAPLRDRMEFITLSSYTEFEKLNIAKTYLLPQSRKENGIGSVKINISDDVILEIINNYTSEAGVRGLRRIFDKICRKIAKELLTDSKAKSKTIKSKDLKDYLGIPFNKGEKNRKKIKKIGVVQGMAWTAVGGVALEVQSVKMEGKGKLQLTGTLGNVMKESAQVAYSYVRHLSKDLGINDKFYENEDIHLHFPAGATPKDGPSAGVTITTAIVSALTDKPVRQDVAMTGEITITGEVLEVGGIKEKVIGAHRVGIHEIILPDGNKQDVDEIPDEVLKDVKIHFAKNYEDVRKIVF